MGLVVHRRGPAALHPGKARYPLYRRLGGPQGRSGRVLKISPPPGFEPLTVQLVASRYTDCAIPNLVTRDKLQLKVITVGFALNSCNIENGMVGSYENFC